MGIFLITTADERTWKFDRQVLFLGEWCRLYRRKQIWQPMNSIVAAPYGLDSQQRFKDLQKVQRLTSELLTEITEALNNVHGTQYSSRYWQIILGHWLFRYTCTIFNRFQTLQQAFKTHDISGTAIFSSREHLLAANSSIDFMYSTNQDIWNNVLYSLMLPFFGNVKTEFVSLHTPNPDDSQPCDGDASPIPRNLKRRLSGAVSKVSSYLSRKNDAFIINSYLPVYQEIELQLRLCQFPQRWQSPPIETIAPDTKIASQYHHHLAQDKLNVELGVLQTEGFQTRSRIQATFNDLAEGHAGLEKLIRILISELLPTCYLEGYKNLIHQVKQLPWPERPKFIFTSNNFDTDEPFKVWTAQKTEEGIPYFTGQHGSNYGTHFCAGNSHVPERLTADRFFTWGWTDNDPKTTPSFNFKIAKIKQRKRNKNGGLLLIEDLLDYPTLPWDIYSPFTTYQESQFQFVRYLPQEIQKQILVRLHQGSLKNRWSDHQRWHDHAPHIAIDAGQASVKTLISESRLIVFSYDSTGILENLALDNPTICFWEGGFDHLLPEAKPYYELLQQAGIFNPSPAAAAETVSRCWKNVESWWRSPTVQESRATFCNQFSRTGKNPVKTLKNLLIAEANALQ